MPPRRRSLFGYDPDLARPDRGDSSPEPLSVSELNKLVRARLESDFPRVEVRGEISNFVSAASGHLYFSLKDQKAQVSVVMWRNQAQRLPVALEDGLAVVARGRLSLYEPRGNFQLIADDIRAEGRGSLEARFLALKAHYEAAGYFAPEHKQPLPFLPAVIGVVTSGSGAAIHDITRTILDRFPRAHIRLAPVRVQGQGAAEEIAEAIARLDRPGFCDVMIVGRGGGSLEDLWAFNEAAVVEAIFAARTPIIAAVGHEVDFSLADFVADHRAATPTAAGEVCIPRLSDLIDLLADNARKLRRSTQERLKSARLQLSSLGRSWALREPLNLLRRREQELDDLRGRMAQALKQRLDRAQRRLDQLGQAPALRDPKFRLAAEVTRLAGMRLRLDALVRQRLERSRAHLAQHERVLQGLSPLRVLERGYSITFGPDGRALKDSEGVGPGDQLRTRLAKTELKSRVE